MTGSDYLQISLVWAVVKKGEFMRIHANEKQHRTARNQLRRLQTAFANLTASLKTTGVLRDNPEMPGSLFVRLDGELTSQQAQYLQRFNRSCAQLI